MWKISFDSKDDEWKVGEFERAHEGKDCFYFRVDAVAEALWRNTWRDLASSPWGVPL